MSTQNADEKPPFPLPDLPRAGASTIGDLARRWLEWNDWEAATRLPDALLDVGRTDGVQVGTSRRVILTRIEQGEPDGSNPTTAPDPAGDALPG